MNLPPPGPPVPSHVRGDYYAYMVGLILCLLGAAVSFMQTGACDGTLFAVPIVAAFMLWASADHSDPPAGDDR
jgi:hypothetical protein